jgi:hypothetical protein
VVSDRHLIAKWVRKNAVMLKRKGASFESIAEYLTQVGQGLVKAEIPLPDDVKLPEGYSITKQSVHRAFQKGLAETPALESAEVRELANQRFDEIWRAMSAGIRKRDPKILAIAVRTLSEWAKLNGAVVDTKADKVDMPELPPLTSDLISAIYRKMVNDALGRKEEPIDVKVTPVSPDGESEPGDETALPALEPPVEEVFDELEPTDPNDPILKFMEKQDGNDDDGDDGAN